MRNINLLSIAIIIFPKYGIIKTLLPIILENVTFPKAKIYEEFLEVFDAEKNSSDYWLNEEQFDKEFGRQHYENSLMNKFWQRICEYVVRQNKI